MKKATPLKTYVVKQIRTHGRSDRADSIKFISGTVEEITQYFSYTLEIGNSWNKKINRYPSTINSLVKNIGLAYDEKEGACYSRTFVDISTVQEMEAYNQSKLASV